MREQPLVSVVTPVHNGERYLRRCIESVIAQSHVNWDYTIVNNCSTDGTLGIALEYASRDHRIRVQSNSSFLHINANYNMAPADAEKCLGNIARLISPGGHLFVSGVDLDVRTKVALYLGWEPVTELIAEIHDGDPSVRADWPWHWWGLEPLNRRRHDWRTRYAASFRIGGPQRLRFGTGFAALPMDTRTAHAICKMKRAQ